MKIIPTAMALWASGMACFAAANDAGSGGGGELVLHLRSRTGDALNEKTAAWDARKTALIICDMWDQHWCKSASRRVAEMAGPLNEVVKTARADGVFIIHAPSTCMEFYKETPQRRRAQAAPFAAAPVPLVTTERWGTAWYWIDGQREGVLPIDDSDMGCSCEGAKCEIRSPWTREIATIEIGADDAITEDLESAGGAGHRPCDPLRGASEYVRAGPAVCDSPDGARGEDRRANAGYDRHDVQPRTAARGEPFCRHGAGD